MDAIRDRRRLLEAIPLDPATGYLDLSERTGLSGAALDGALADLEALGLIASKKTVDQVYYWPVSTEREKAWYSVVEAANYLSVSKRTVQQLIRDGEMIAYRVGRGGHHRIRKADLDSPMHIEPHIESHREPHGKIAEMGDAEDLVLNELWDNERDAEYDQI
ncbi:MAG: excisionase family DNA-binding protein [Chloroflexi bacterium]|nr:excisionase family DNA-binding protein [Chloroflexota bacterium]MDA1270464.1 excisionase family DNA-binding protein [Chloroflexota bacterium]